MASSLEAEVPSPPLSSSCLRYSSLSLPPTLPVSSPPHLTRALMVQGSAETGRTAFWPCTLTRRRLAGGGAGASRGGEGVPRRKTCRDGLAGQMVLAAAAASAAAAEEEAEEQEAEEQEAEEQAAEEQEAEEQAAAEEEEEGRRRTGCG